MRDNTNQKMMRVRITNKRWDCLLEAAEYESERTGEHVTVSDLVRSAINNYLLMHESLQTIENFPPDLACEPMVVIADLAVG